MVFMTLSLLRPKKDKSVHKIWTAANYLLKRVDKVNNRLANTIPIQAYALQLELDAAAYVAACLSL